MIINQPESLLLRSVQDGYLTKLKIIHAEKEIDEELSQLNMDFESGPTNNCDDIQSSQSRKQSSDFKTHLEQSTIQNKS